MFHSWDARIVSLLARLLKYPPSCQDAIVGSISQQFDYDPLFFKSGNGKAFTFD